jgi:hypothetical protein
MSRVHRSLRSSLALPLALSATLFLAGCGDGVSGTYIAEGGMPMTMQFKGGGKVVVSGAGDTQEGTYTVSGDKVVVNVKEFGEPLTLVKRSDGALTSQGGMFTVTLKKK